MKLSAITIERYRSIAEAKKIPLSNYTVIIGKNNEGKSNILRALNVALTVIQTHSPIVGRLYKYRSLEHEYSWERDFPVSLSSSSKNSKKPKESEFLLEFVLSEDEIQEFKEATTISLNGTLPIRIKIGSENNPQVTVAKPGKAVAKYRQKQRQILQFIKDHVQIGYIPAVRTEAHTNEFIKRLVSQASRKAEQDPKYQAALKVIYQVQSEIVNDLAKEVQQSLKRFVPNIKKVRLQTNESSLRRVVSGGIEFIIDDGTPTALEDKGDGLKNLVALALFKHRAGDFEGFIYAFEEPESHLHPGAVHELRSTLSDIAQSNQVIISTHNPIFVDRNPDATTILVDGGRAERARTVAKIRETLGVRISDNMVNSELALLLEGPSDVDIVGKIISRNDLLRRAIMDKRLVLESLSGTGNLSARVTALRQNVLKPLAMLDDDSSAAKEIRAAQRQGLLGEGQYITCRRLSRQGSESEIENLFTDDFIESALTDPGGGHIFEVRTVCQYQEILRLFAAVY